ncbi:MAG: aldo/keto reductase [Candidatus Woesearchaeota archaeon]|jgi:diketogulonate reductase-like aldo/keto reductase|nr:aldo/keto reductase [Candidatus Woesearchaeota archaeon]MDP7457149.1 aldo/keto reductase [Candidatus Woesearchaeota archaeon]
MQTKTLPSGEKIPLLGLGTWESRGSDVKSAVKSALELGYTHIDTAWIYQNQFQIGDALKDVNVERSKLFITSKIWMDYLHYKDALQNAEETLQQLQTDYVDLLLIHWPRKEVPMEETFKALKELNEQGKAKSIGVSNFTINHLKKAIEISEIPISMNQVEFNPYLNQQELLNFCKDNKISLTAYCPLGRGGVLADPVLKEISNTHNKTPAQVSLRWLLQQGIIVIPKSVTPERIKENMDIFDWDLSEEEMKRIGSLNKNHRICNFEFAEFND